VFEEEVEVALLGLEQRREGALVNVAALVKAMFRRRVWECRRRKRTHRDDLVTKDYCFSFRSQERNIKQTGFFFLFPFFSDSYNSIDGGDAFHLRGNKTSVAAAVKLKLKLKLILFTNGPYNKAHLLSHGPPNYIKYFSYGPLSINLAILLSIFFITKIAE